MKILFAIQGTGNGHLSRAQTLLPEIKKYGEVDILISGNKADIKMSHPVKFFYKGLSFSFGKQGGIDFRKSLTEANIYRLIKEYESIPVEKYDLVINDFEPLTAWSCRVKQIPCIGLSHQSALFQPFVPMPTENNWLGSFILQYYAPVPDAVSFHFQAYNPSIFTPVIRNDIRKMRKSNKGHLSVYLPAYADEYIAGILADIRGIKADIFSKSGTRKQTNAAIRILPIETQAFALSMASSDAILCGAGFETPAEALFLNKKLMVIPMKNQFEQQCNATALADLGVNVLSSLQSENTAEIKHWLESDNKIHLDYPDHNKEVIQTVFEKFDALKSRSGSKTSSVKNARPLVPNFM
ncbi:MAG: glycosyltransferase family protein [Bacteroidales bacterium]|nr:glycosyltransferase family protein [Bacteroidales bacterium]